MKRRAEFIEPMLLRRASELPHGPEWMKELKMDGYRAVAFKSGGKLHLRSRNDNDFSLRYPAIVKALSGLPDETVVDGETVAVDESGRPSFNLLQNYGSSKMPILYYVFDVMLLAGKDVMGPNARIMSGTARKQGAANTGRADLVFPVLPGSVADLVRVYFFSPAVQF